MSRAIWSSLRPRDTAGRFSGFVRLFSGGTGNRCPVGPDRELDRLRCHLVGNCTFPLADHGPIPVLRNATLAVLLFGLCPASAIAGGSVRGHGEVLNPAPLSPSQISVDAWLNDNGVAHGVMVWIGDIIPGSLPKTGPAAPFLIDVQHIPHCFSLFMQCIRRTASREDNPQGDESLLRGE